jgi:hypothetical protein
MTRVAEIPDVTALLCEGCGYTLHQAPPEGNCPECGMPISESRPELRHVSAWEDRQDYGAIRGFAVTTARALFTPRSFFRGLSIPGSTLETSRVSTFRSSQVFGHVYRLLSAVLLGVTASVHFDFLALSQSPRGLTQIPGLTAAIATAFAWVSVELLILAVVRLTAWEAAYRGLRLPRAVVARALDFHAVHLVPPALLGLVTVLAYDALMSRDANLAGEWIMTYIYTLSGEVIVSAGYVFVTYWIAMKNLMYANR